jgi:hypothetical protein
LVVVKELQKLPKSGFAEIVGWQLFKKRPSRMWRLEREKIAWLTAC